ncbi:Ltp family lipoprotein [Vagococcus sp. CY52-2]
MSDYAEQFSQESGNYAIDHLSK